MNVSVVVDVDVNVVVVVDMAVNVVVIGFWFER
jgi:hypothetical protein